MRRAGQNQTSLSETRALLSSPCLCSTMPKGIPAPGPWDLPGDVSTLSNEGLAEGESIWVRLATIVRARRLDLRLLMNACDLHNRGM
jgi:hypothetical protein